MKTWIRALYGLAGEFPLESGLVLWASIVGTISVLSDTPSAALAMLPAPVDTAWSIGLLIAASATARGLWKRNVSPSLATAMSLFGILFLAYAVAVVTTTGWSRGGAVAGLTATLALSCVLRSRRLRAMRDILLVERIRIREEGQE